MTEQDINIKFQPKPTDPRFQDLEGHRFGRLVVIGFLGNRPPRSKVWCCKCDCGVVKGILGSALRKGRTVSCGCYHSEIIKKPKKHGESANHIVSAEYRTWLSIRTRCNSPFEKNYGARGVKCCFETFEDFLAEVGRKPTPKHSIDRINVNGHYEKGNVRWATSKEQMRNTRFNVHITIDGVTKTQKEWANQSGIHASQILQRRRLGWCAKCSVFNAPRVSCLHR